MALQMLVTLLAVTAAPAPPPGRTGTPLKTPGYTAAAFRVLEMGR